MISSSFSISINIKSRVPVLLLVILNGAGPTLITIFHMNGSELMNTNLYCKSVFSPFVGWWFHISRSFACVELTFCMQPTWCTSIFRLLPYLSGGWITIPQKAVDPMLSMALLC